MRPSHPGPAVGVVTALPIECYAVLSVLRAATRVETPLPGDAATYYLGDLPSSVSDSPHRVVLCLLPEDGGVAAAHACANLHRSWGVSQIIMCGIACGVPTPQDPARHVRLGDILVAEDGVVPYGHVRAEADREEIRRSAAKPSALLKAAARRIKVAEEHGCRNWEPLLDVYGRPELREYRRPSDVSDVLLDDESDIIIPHPPRQRSGHVRGRPKVHYGRIGSGGKLIRSSAERNRLAQRHRLIGFDMEGDGISDGAHLQGIDWFMVRGVSDYGAGKNDLWHRYASLAAAAYVGALLGETGPFHRHPVAHLPLPPQRPGGHTTAAGNLDAVVAVLMRVRSMGSRTDRDRVIAGLPEGYRNLPREASMYHDVRAIVDTLHHLPDGLRLLHQALLEVEHESLALRQLAPLIDGPPELDHQ